MSYFSMLCGRPTPEMAMWLFKGYFAYKVGGFRLFSTHLDSPRCTPMLTCTLVCYVLSFDQKYFRQTIEYKVNLDTLQLPSGCPLQGLKTD
jgi:hypothetical protein